MKRRIDYSVYLVTDRGLMSTKTLREAVEKAIIGGCTLVQLREKEISSLAFYRTAAELKQLTDGYNIPLIINDRVDIALAVDADGVHIGQSDIPAAAVRGIIGDDKVLGVSVSSLAQARQAEADGADYLGVGAMFSTGTKSDAALVSMEELRRIREAVRLPLVVIGGIHAGNAAEYKAVGIDGLAVVSAIIAQKDIAAATQRLKRRFNGYKIKGAIFDLDGTLLDSMGVWERIDIDFLAKRGYTVPENYVAKICAMSFREAAVYTAEIFSLAESPEEIMAEWNGMAIEEYSHRVKLKPYVLDYLQKLRADGVKLGVATGLSKFLYEPALKSNGILDLFDAIASTDEVGRGKGFPDVFLLAAKKLGAKPCDCIVFEDILEGITSAKRADMAVCGVYDRYSERFAESIKRLADEYILDFSEAPVLSPLE